MWPRKGRRACSQGRNRGTAPQTPQGLLSGKHTMCGAEKSEWPILEQIRTPLCSQNSNCSSNANSLPNASLQPKGQFAAQTPIRSRLLVCSPNANLHTLSIFAAQTHFSCPNACITEVLPRKHHRACCLGSMRCAALLSPKGLLAGTQSSCGPAKTAGPVVGEAYDVRPDKSKGLVRRDAIELRRRKHRRAC